MFRLHSFSADVHDDGLVYLLVDEGQRLYQHEANATELFNTMKALKGHVHLGSSPKQQPRLRVVFATTYGSQPSGVNFEADRPFTENVSDPDYTGGDSEDDVGHQISFFLLFLAAYEQLIVWQYECVIDPHKQWSFQLNSTHLQFTVNDAATSKLQTSRQKSQEMAVAGPQMALKRLVAWQEDFDYKDPSPEPASSPENWPEEQVIDMFARSQSGLCLRFSEQEVAMLISNVRKAFPELKKLWTQDEVIRLVSNLTGLLVSDWFHSGSSDRYLQISP